LYKDGFVIATDVTDEFGEYDFYNLSEGTYVVCEQFQPYWTQTYPLGGGCYTVTIDLNATYQYWGLDFYNYAPEGCTPGFWQGGSGRLLWDLNSAYDSGSDTWFDPDWVASGGDGYNPYVHATLFDDFFTAYDPPGGDTGTAGFEMIDFVSTGGGNKPWRKAARDVVAAYLNASWGMDYPYTTTEIWDMWHASATTGSSFTQIHELLGSANNPEGGRCPIP
jgi:hypothetical protein